MTLRALLWTVRHLPALATVLGVACLAGAGLAIIL